MQTQRREDNPGGITPVVMKHAEAIKAQARDKGLSPSLIAGICMRESIGSGGTWASRYEPDWAYFFEVEVFAKKCGITVDTERVQQATSHGLMQVMGSVAREHGLTDNLTRLYHPETNLHYGCLHLRKFLDRFGSEEKAVAAYNRGWPQHKPDGSFVNQAYVDSVLRYRAGFLGLD